MARGDVQKIIEGIRLRQYQVGITRTPSPLAVKFVAPVQRRKADSDQGPGRQDLPADMLWGVPLARERVTERTPLLTVWRLAPLFILLLVFAAGWMAGRWLGWPLPRWVERPLSRTLPLLSDGRDGGQQELTAATKAGTPTGRLEGEIVRVVNQARERRGLRPLRDEPQLHLVARRHSEDMAARQFFSHLNLEGQDVVYRLRAGGIDRFIEVGENLLTKKEMAHSPLLTVREWLKNSPDRKNLLHPDYTSTGVGIARSRDETIYITQVYLQR